MQLTLMDEIRSEQTRLNFKSENNNRRQIKDLN